MKALDVVKITIDAKKIYMKDIMTEVSNHLGGFRKDAQACVLINLSKSGTYILVDTNRIISVNREELNLQLRKYKLACVQDVDLLKEHVKYFYEVRQVNSNIKKYLEQGV